ncbi:hypothetical protein [Dickeya oryzae]
MKKNLFLLLAFLSMNVSAECWVVNNFKGYAAYNEDKYQFQESSLMGGDININISDNEVSVKQVGNSLFGHGLKFNRVSKTAIMGMDDSLGETVIESWAITKEKKGSFL